MNSFHVLKTSIKWCVFLLRHLKCFLFIGICSSTFAENTHPRTWIEVNVLPDQRFLSFQTAFQAYKDYEDQLNISRYPSQQISVLDYGLSPYSYLFNGEQGVYTFIYTTPGDCPSSTSPCKNGNMMEINSECAFESTTIFESVSGGYKVYCVMPNSPPPDLSCKSPRAGNPIFPANGLKEENATDYIANETVALKFTRMYRSDRNEWRHNYRSFGKHLNSILIARDQIKSACLIGVGGYTKESYCFSYFGNGADSDFLLQRANDRLLKFNTQNSLAPVTADISDKVRIILDNTGATIGYRVTNSENDQIEQYDQTGRMQSVTSRTGRVETLTYSVASTSLSIAPQSGLLIRVADIFGRQLNFTYDANGLMTTMTDPASQIYRYAYDERTSIVLSGQKPVGNLTSVTYPDGKKRLYWYNEQDKTSNTNLPFSLTGITDENGIRFATYQYDSTGKAISTEHANGVERYQVSYPSRYTESTVVDPLGTSRSFNFQTVLGVVKSTGQSQPGGSGCAAASNATTFDANGNVSTRTDFNSVTTTFTYDLSRNLETSRVEGFGTPQARTTSTQWHATYRLPLKIAEPSRLTTFTYDASGNVLTKVVRATSDVNGASAFSAALIGTPRTWTWTYNGFGQILTADGPRTDTGIVDKTTFTYETMGNLASSTDASGKLTVFNSYDLNGRLLKMTDPAGVVTTMTYSPRGWLTSRNVVSGTASELTSYAYDGVGQLTLVTLPDASTVSYIYDDAHRLTQVSDSTGNRIAYTLDAMGNRVSEQVTDPAGVLVRQTSRVYDALNRLQQVTGAVQ